MFFAAHQPVIVRKAMEMKDLVSVDRNSRRGIEVRIDLRYAAVTHRLAPYLPVSCIYSNFIHYANKIIV